MSLSVILVTSGRPSLDRTLKSIYAQGLEKDDEVLVVGNDPTSERLAKQYKCRYVQDGPFGNWGQVERQNAMRHAKGTHLLFMDDDDRYLEGAFKAIRDATESLPVHPIMFRMLPPNVDFTIWMNPQLVCGNVSGQQFVVPNVPEKLGTWGVFREGDFKFILETVQNFGHMFWDSTVIVACQDREPD